MVDVTFPVPALKINQKEKEGQAIYIASFKVSDFYDRNTERFDIRIYKRIFKDGIYTDDGYQRAPNEKKVKQIRDFINNQADKHPVFPTAIVVCTQNKLFYNEKDKKLTITPKLYIIDGQHRMQAWYELMKDGAYSNLSDYEMPVIILSGFSEIEEVIQFHILNSRQTKIKTDLAHNHYLKLLRSDDDKIKKFVAEKDKWIGPANLISKSLNEQKAGVWSGKMANANEKDKKILGNTTIALSSFTTSLKPFFVKDRIFHGHKQEDKNTKLLSDYWNGIDSVWSAALDAQNKYYLSYVLMKTIGVFSMHYLLSLCLYKCKDPYLAINEATRILKLAMRNGMDDSYWYTKTNLRNSQRMQKGEYAMAHSSGSGHIFIVEYIFKTAGVNIEDYRRNDD